METKYVGLIIRDKARLFSNGITQNAYFMYQCLTNAGFPCRFLCRESSPSKLEYFDCPLYTVSADRDVFNPAEYSALILITGGLTPDEYFLFKKAGIFIASFICGNTVMHNMEDFVRGPTSAGASTYIGRDAHSDELWVIPSYHDSLPYLETTRGIRAFIVPHLWSPLFLSTDMSRVLKQSESELFFKTETHTAPKVNLFILEPNLAVFKNAWLPLIAAEKFDQLFPDILDQVYVFNFPENNASYEMVDCLELSKKKKIRYFKRLAVTEIFMYFNKQPSFPILVSHQISNSLNYLYYEALHYGWPLVHNSPDLDGCGYFYPEYDFSTCAHQIHTAFLHHNKNFNLYCEKAREYLKRVDPLDGEMAKIWRGCLNAGIARHSIKPGKRRLILCGDNRSLEEEGYWKYMIPVTRCYAEKHKIDFQFILFKEKYDNRHYAWNRIKILEEFVDKYDEILWIDSDATITNHSIDVFQELKFTKEMPEWKRDERIQPVIYAISNKPYSQTGCSGIFMIDCYDKDRVKKTLSDWWSDFPDEKYKTQHPWEQSVWMVNWAVDPVKRSTIRVADLWSFFKKSEDQCFIHIASTYGEKRLEECQKIYHSFF